MGGHFFPAASFLPRRMLCSSIFDPKETGSGRFNPVCERKREKATGLVEAGRSAKKETGDRKRGRR